MMKVVLGILLVILKFLGWLVLGVLVLILLILAVLLLVPIRYRVTASAEDAVEAHVAATWLLHLVRFDAVFRERKLTMTYRILWMHHRPGEERKATEKPRKAAIPSPGEPSVDETAYEMEKPEAMPESEKERIQMTPTEPKAIVSHKKGGLRRISEACRGVYRRFCRFGDSLRSLKKSAEDAVGKIRSATGYIQNYPDGRELIWRFRRALWYCFRRIRPRRLHLAVRFGFEDPSRTGTCMAAYGVLSSLCLADIKQYRIDIDPDFENSILEGSLEMKGRIALYMILFPAVRLVLNKKVRKLIRDLKTIKEVL